MIAHMITTMQVYCSYTDEKCEGCAGLPDARPPTEKQVATSVESFKGVANGFHRGKEDVNPSTLKREGCGTHPSVHQFPIDGSSRMIHSGGCATKKENSMPHPPGHPLAIAPSAERLSKPEVTQASLYQRIAL